MVDRMPDRDRFRATFGTVIERVSPDRVWVGIHGEMVSLLWEQGNVAAVIAVEDLWNDLAGSSLFTLLCTYPTLAFEPPASTVAFRTVCRQHTGVVPTESHSRLSRLH